MDSKKLSIYKINYFLFSIKSLTIATNSSIETVTCSFDITINNVDTKFDYLRLYSIVRTSIDSTPLVKRVIDIDLKTIIGNKCVITDNG